MKKPVILHCINSLGVGGAEVLLRDTVKILDAFEHIICYLRAPDTLVPDFQGYTIYNLGHTSWIHSYRTSQRLKKIIKKHEVLLVHSHLFETTLLARLATSKKIKFFFTIHNVLSKDAFEINSLSIIAEKLTYNKSHNLIAVSEVALKDYDKWIGVKGKAYVLYNYVNQKFFDLQYDYGKTVNKDFKLIAVGNLRRQKNYAILLEAFALLKDQPVSLDIYGSGELKEQLQKMIDQKGLNVRLMGRVEDVSNVLLNYHAYIMPSLFEGYGIAPMEAMAAGMPVLLSNLPVFKEICGELPVFFNPKDPAGIAQVIQHTHQNWEDIKWRAKGVKEEILKKGSKETYLKKIMEIYKLYEC